MNDHIHGPMGGGDVARNARSTVTLASMRGSLAAMLGRLALFALLLLLPLPAIAQTPPTKSGRVFGVDDEPTLGLPVARQRAAVRLDYLRGPGAEGCPDESLFRGAVSARAHYEVFQANGPERLVVTLARGPRGYQGRAELRDATGEVRLQTAFPWTATCARLVDDLALAVALHVAPPAAPGPPSSPPPTPPAGAAPPGQDVPQKPAEGPPAPPVEGLRLRLTGGAWVDLATAPRPALGLSLGLGLRWRWLSLEGELHGTPPAGATIGSAGAAQQDVTMSRISGALIPCAHVGMFLACAVGELGRVRGSLASYESKGGLWGAGGARFGAEIPLGTPRIQLRIAGDMLGARPVQVLRGGAKVWESGSFVGSAGLGLVVEL